MMVIPIPECIVARPTHHHRRRPSLVGLKGRVHCFSMQVVINKFFS